MTDLTSVIGAHLYEPRRYEHLRDCSCGWKSSVGHGAKTLDYAAHLAAAIREAATITTVEQLDALPGDTFIRDVDGDVLKLAPFRESFAWYYIGLEGPLAANEIGLPALVLWTPEEQR